MTEIASKVGLVICSELMTVSQITSAAKALGLQVETVLHSTQALIKAALGGYACIILDLEMQPLVVKDFIANCKGNPPVVAFGPHVDTTRLSEGRSAGCTLVLTRSQFHAQLPEILKKYLAE